MADHFLASIEALQTDLRGLEEKVVKTKQLINMLADRAAVPAPYPDADLAMPSHSSAVATDEFFNKPLFRCAKAFLARRKAGGGGPATAEDIYNGLLAGGYNKFPTSKDDALGGLRISLGKSSHTFARLPNGSYGLTEWYGMKKPRNGKADEKAGGDQPEEADGDDETDEATATATETVASATAADVTPTTGRSRVSPEFVRQNAKDARDGEENDA